MAHFWRWLFFGCCAALLVLSGAQKVTADGPVPPQNPDAMPKIIGGNLAGEHAYPWQVALLHASEPDPFMGQFCGGTLVDPQWVLTAAHCVYTDDEMTQLSNPASIHVGMGVNLLSDMPTSLTPNLRVAVDAIVPGPEVSYTLNRPDGDVALLHLATPVSFSSAIQPITLAGSEDAALLNAGTTAVITGWGATSVSGPNPDYPNELYDVQVPIVSDANCQDAYGGGLISGSMFCAGLDEGGKDSCQGDSGGPLIVQDGATWKEVGVVSWGDGCALPGKYGVYTRVANYQAWVAQTISEGIHFTHVYLPEVLANPQP
jgi:secreted trypsin-like serine protease